MPALFPQQNAPRDLRDLEHPAGVRSSRRADSGVPLPPRKWKTRVLVPGAIVAVTLALLGYTLRDTIWPSTPVTVVPVVVKTVSDAGVSASVQAPGWVEADPFPVYVSGLADGVIREILALEGHRVTAGQVVARLVDEDARIEDEVATAELRQAEAELLAAQASLAAAERTLETLVGPRRDVAVMEAKLAEARAEAALNPIKLVGEQAKARELREEATRKASLRAEGAITEFEVLVARLRAEAQEAAVAENKSRLGVLEAKVREFEAELAGAKEALALRIEQTRAAAEAKAAVAKASAAIAQKSAAKKAAALRLSRMEIKAPVDGVVQQRIKQVGDTIMLGGNMERPAQVMRLYDPAKLQVRVDVPLADAAQVGVGQRAKVVVGVLPDQPFDGEITRVVNEADIQKNTLQVKVAIRNPSPHIKPEMLARVRFLPMDRATAAAEAVAQVFVPETLVQTEGGKPAVWIVEKGRAVRREITLGQTRNEGWVVAASGLVPGDRLIAEPAGIKAGQKVHAAGESRHEGK